MMKVLIIGSGGREHALAWKMAQSSQVTKIFVAPGNGGTQSFCDNVPIDASDIEALCYFASSKKIDLTVVGPEVPLALGVVDAFKQRNLLCLGPKKQAAQLESSKVFSKAFMRQHGIPTANYERFSNKTLAKSYLNTQSFPVVIKMDGLAAGKGVVIAENRDHAEQAIDQFLDDKEEKVEKFVIIEAYLQGQEVSFMVITDGKTVIPFASSQDHKALQDGDQGLNTGGMGAYSPAPMLTKTLEAEVMDKVIYPTLNGMADLGCPYQGFLYAGLMITPSQDIQVLEFNCRLGDPETQVLMMRLKSDLFSLCQAACLRELHLLPTLTWTTQSSLGVVMASKGYPGPYKKGLIIEGLKPVLTDLDGCQIFHAGTSYCHEKKAYQTQGGRVLCVTAVGDDLAKAKSNAYDHVKKLHWAGVHYRSDIGDKGLI